MATERDAAGVVAPPPIIFGVPLVVALYENTSHPLPLIPPPAGYIVGGVLILIGIAMVIAAELQFRRARTSIVPYRPTTAIITSGLFSFSRNPLYLSLVLIYVGVACVFNTSWPLILLPLVLFTMHRGVILREENYLARKFGDEYLSYKSRVRRWI